MQRVVPGRCCVGDEEHEVGGGDLGVSAGNAFGFDGVIWVGGGHSPPYLAEAGGVDQLDGPAAQGGRGGEHVAGGAGVTPDDGSLVAENRVHQAAFAGVGPASDDD